MTTLARRVGWHRWGMWSDPSATEYERPAFTVAGYGMTSHTATETVEFTVFEQSRSCHECGIAQRRQVPRA